jgi:hypothetical protein
MKTISAEEKRLRKIALNASTKRGYPVKQETPFCKTSHIKVDVMDPHVKVDFPVVKAGGNTFMPAEPP